MRWRTGRRSSGWRRSRSVSRFPRTRQWVNRAGPDRAWSGRRPGCCAPASQPGPAQVQFTFGLPGDRKVVGDWNGDGTRTPRRLPGPHLVPAATAIGAGGSTTSFPSGQSGRPARGRRLERRRHRDHRDLPRPASGTSETPKSRARRRSTSSSTAGRVTRRSPGTGTATASTPSASTARREAAARQHRGGAADHIVPGYGTRGTRPVTGDWDRNGADRSASSRAPTGT